MTGSALRWQPTELFSLTQACPSTPPPQEAHHLVDHQCGGDGNGEARRNDTLAAEEKLDKHIYDYLVTDSKIERQFVTELETSTEVIVCAKLPRGFSIPTPMGDYNPDRVIDFHEGAVKHVYFVAETKGSLSSLQLKGVEDAKIERALRIFESLGSINGDSVKYDVVTDYTQLVGVVA